MNRNFIYKISLHHYAAQLKITSAVISSLKNNIEESCRDRLILILYTLLIIYYYYFNLRLLPHNTAMILYVLHLRRTVVKFLGAI